MRAAKYLNVAPWELAERPVYWQRLALWFEEAELKAPDVAEKVQAQRDTVASGGGRQGGSREED